MKEDNKIYLSAKEVDAIDEAQDALRSKKSFATFVKHTDLQTVYKFIHNSLEFYYRDVEINDSIIGKWDVRPFIRRKYKITIEELPD